MISLTWALFVCFDLSLLLLNIDDLYDQSDLGVYSCSANSSLGFEKATIDVSGPGFLYDDRDDYVIAIDVSGPGLSSLR